MIRSALVFFVLITAVHSAGAQDDGTAAPPIPKPALDELNSDMPAWSTSPQLVRTQATPSSASSSRNRETYFAQTVDAEVEATDLVRPEELATSAPTVFGSIAGSSREGTVLGRESVRVGPPQDLRPAEGDQLLPTMTSDPQNNLYVAYEDRNVPLVSQNGDTTFVRGIRVLRSTDGGQSWSYFLTLGDRSDSFYKPSITYAQGYIFVAYRRSSGPLTVFRKPLSGWSGVAQFSPPMPIRVDRSQWVMDVRIVSDAKIYDAVGTSALYLTFAIARKPDRYSDPVSNLYFTRSLTLGADWTQPQTLVDDWRLAAYDSYRSVGMDFGGALLEPVLYLTYAYKTASETEYRLITSGDWGATLSSPTVLSALDSGYLYSLDVAAKGASAVASVSAQVGSAGFLGGFVGTEYGPSLQAATWFTTDGGDTWQPNSLAVNAVHADVSHDGDGNFYAVYWQADRTARFEIGDGTPKIASLPVELSRVESRGLIFDTDPGIAGLWSGTGAVATYTVSSEPPDTFFDPEYFSDIGGNRIVALDEPDISLAPTRVEVYQAAPPLGSVEDDPSWERVPDRVIVAVRQDASGKMPEDLGELHSRAGAVDISPLLELSPSASGKSGAAAAPTSVFVARLDGQRPIEEAMQVYERHPSVVFAEPDYLYYPDVVPNDPLYAEQWGLANREQARPYTGSYTVGTWGSDIDAERAWDVTTGSPDITVAVIDDGVDASHPDFTGRVLPGYDFINDDADASPGPDDGHGTAVAGIIAAAGNNGIGVAGVAWNVGILPVKVFDGGPTSSSIIAQAVAWSADQGADVVNMSLGGPGYSQLLEMAVDYAHSLDAVVISAAGNSNLDNRTNTHYPAGYRNSLSIGALSPCNTRKRSANSSLVPDGRGRDPEGMSCDEEYWWGSHFGDLDVLAPGVRIHTTDVTGALGYSDGDYLSTFNGTSAATPFAAGVAALVRSAAPDLTNDEVRAVLQLSAEDMGESGWDADTGHGRLNAYRAVLLARGMETPGEVLVYNRGTQPLSVSASSDRPWLQIASAPTSVASGDVGGIEVAVDWSDPAFAAGLPISAVIEIVSNDPDEQQLGVLVEAVPSATDCRRLWTVPITVSGSSGTLVTQFGEGVNATDGPDAGCREEASTDGNTAFQLPTGDLSRTDIRGPDGEHDWTLALSGSSTYQLSWSPDDLPDGTFFMTVGAGDPLDMGTTESVSITDPTVSTVTISRRDMVCFTSSRRFSGWYQRTLPVAVGDDAADTVFPGARLTYSHAGQYRDVQRLTPGQGYWAYFQGGTQNNSDRDTVCGSKVPVGDRTIELSAGWNMIGTFENPVGPAQLVTDPPGLLVDSVRTYVGFGIYGRYAAVDTLYPTVAYWVLASGDGTLSYAPPTSAAISNAFAIERSIESASRLKTTPGTLTSRQAAAVETDLTIRADGGSTTQLTYGLDPCASREEDACVGERIVPPFSPDSTLVDARFIGRGRYAETTDWVADHTEAQFGYVDIRRGDTGANRTIEHFFRVKWPAGETTLTFEWNLPQGATARLAENVDEEDGEIPRFVTQMSGLGSEAITDPDVVDFRLTVTYEDVISTNNVPPQAVDDTVATLPARPLLVFPMFNDDDVDGDPLTLLSYTQPRHGTATSPRPDAILYTPDKTFVGTDSLDYVIRDPAGGLDTATVIIDVTHATGDPPITVEAGSDGVLAGTRFVAAVIIGSPMAPVDGLAGASVELRYDTNVLSVIEGTIQPDAFIGPDQVTIDPVIDPVAGTIALSVARKGGGRGSSGEGSIARMTFDVLPTASAGSTLIEVTDALAVDSLGNEIPVERVAGTIEVVRPRLVWPGLTGLDSVVESTDVFPIADCFGLTGPLRLSGTTIDWQAFQVMPWYFPAGDSRCSVASLIDPGAADTNGDGIINEEDLQAILANFRLSTSGKSAKTQAAALDSVYVPVSPVGTEYAFDLTLGSAGEPVNGTVGVSARLSLPPGVLSLAGIDAGTALDDGDLLMFEYFDPSTGAVETAAVRKRGSEAIASAGAVATVRVQVASAMTEPAKVTLDGLTGNVAGSGPVEITSEPAGVSQPVVVAVAETGELPATLGISSVYPNPFQSSATAAVEVPEAGDVRLVLFDAIGRLVAVPFDGRVTAGRYSWPIRVGNLPSGTYFLRLESENRQVTVPVVRVR